MRIPTVPYKMRETTLKLIYLQNRNSAHLQTTLKLKSTISQNLIIKHKNVKKRTTIEIVCQNQRVTIIFMNT